MRFINPFVAAVKDVFKTMVATEITVGKPFVVQSHEKPSADASAVIGLSGDAAGCVVLSLPMTTAVNAAGKFAGVEMTQDHPDFCDALGELANMVAGQAKAKFEGVSVAISLPSVIIGREHVVSKSKQAPRLALPCESALGPFWVEIAMVIEKPAEVAQAPAVAGARA